MLPRAWGFQNRQKDRTSGNGGISFYRNAEEIDVNVALSLVPRPVTTGIMATAMPVAIRPYSIAVAPLSSFRNLKMTRTMAAPYRADSLSLQSLLAI